MPAVHEPRQLDTLSFIPDSPRDLHYLAKSLLFAIPAISIGIQISTWIGFALSDMKQHVDFSVFYLAGWLVRTSQLDKLYPLNPPTFDFIHPAYEAPLFVPFTLLSPVAAYIVWMGVCVAVLGLIIYLLRNETLELRSVSRVLPVTLALAFFPVSYSIAQGQDSLLLALLITLAFLKMKSGDEFSAGVLLGFGSFRFQFLVPIAILFLAWKTWKPILGMISGGLCALLASIAVTGISGQVAYFKMLRLLAQPSSQHVHRMSNLRAVLFASGIQSALVVAIASILVLGLLAWLGRNLNSATKLLFAICASCLLSYHFFMHDMSVLVIPLLILANAAILSADYWTMGLLGAAILAPELVIMLGSADALWACAIVPILLILAMMARFNALSEAPESLAHVGLSTHNSLDTAHP